LCLYYFVPTMTLQREIGDIHFHFAVARKMCVLLNDSCDDLLVFSVEMRKRLKLLTHYF